MYQFHIVLGILQPLLLTCFFLCVKYLAKPLAIRTPSGLFVPLYLLMTRSQILSHFGSPGGTSSGLGLCMGIYCRLLRPIPFSISATLALTEVGETSDTFPVVPLELLPPVSTGSSNATLALSLALSSAVKVQVV